MAQVFNARQFREEMERSGKNVSSERYICRGIRKREREERQAETDKREFKKLKQEGAVIVGRNRYDTWRHNSTAYKGTMTQTPEAQKMADEIIKRAREEKQRRKDRETGCTKPADRLRKYTTLKQGPRTYNDTPTLFREHILKLVDPPKANPEPGDPGFVMHLPPTPSLGPSPPQSSAPANSTAPKHQRPSTRADPLFMNAAKRGFTYQGHVSSPVPGANTGNRTVKISPVLKEKDLSKAALDKKQEVETATNVDGETNLPKKKMSLEDDMKRRDEEVEKERERVEKMTGN